MVRIMGISKGQLDNAERLRNIAYKILMESGIIACCDAHEDFQYRKMKIDEPQIYAMATKQLKKLYPEETNTTLFCEQIHYILEEIPATSAEQCPFCQKVLDE